VSAQEGGTNLLVNGDFEWWDWDIRSWPFQDGTPEVQVCPGWRAFYLDEPPAGVTEPEMWKRPEFRDVKASEYAYRVRSGNLAQKYFTFGGQHIAGLYQQVSGIEPGTPLRFSIYMQTWSCMAGDEGWNICPTGYKSNNPPPMHTKVGIDPTGGTDFWSANVVWGPELNAYDVWTLFQVDAVAQNSAVTVFTYSYADWFDSIFRMHNDVYIDDASLVALNEEPQPTQTQTPAPTATLDPSQPTFTPFPTADSYPARYRYAYARRLYHLCCASWRHAHNYRQSTPGASGADCTAQQFKRYQSVICRAAVGDSCAPGDCHVAAHPAAITYADPCSSHSNLNTYSFAACFPYGHDIADDAAAFAVIAYRASGINFDAGNRVNHGIVVGGGRDGDYHLGVVRDNYSIAA